MYLNKTLISLLDNNTHSCSAKQHLTQTKIWNILDGMNTNVGMVLMLIFFVCRTFVYKMLITKLSSLTRILCLKDNMYDESTS